MMKTSLEMMTETHRKQSYHSPSLDPDTSYIHMATRLISHIQVGVMLLDEERRLIEINRMASQYLGLERTSVLFHPIEEIISCLSHEQPDFNRLVSFLTSSLEKQDQLEIKWIMRGRINKLLITATPTDRLECDCRGTYFFIENVTKVRALEEQVRCNQRLATIGQIAAGAAHEIRNPLTSLRGFLQVIGYRLKEIGQKKEQGYIDIMLKEINRINHLVSEFLSLSKPDNVNLKPVRVSKVLGEILPIIKSEAILHNIDVMIQTPCKLTKVIADEELLKQVFLNICKNGIEAIGEGGLLTIGFRRDESNDYFIVDITDTGSGIPESLRDKIFEPFFTTKENGTGLGLPICQQIIREIGGAITLKTGSYGTTFSVYLPDTML
ncbi:ATP-binding protein [Thermoflavimicrobium daqui]|uniref:histidine kinase n=1 Tax=Thermoflavimicrobium daqui TaxID=2137476 RepID=A0A364K3N0_9BACL|nr:ATP-binding protein [Thermoflavimicrobium daqui]RAL23455.1 PAS domain-containing sensor histidine kinase [Thermoflavimicrobium daqui]